jgi:membrane fusion protein, multidrug efflux system
MPLRLHPRFLTVVFLPALLLAACSAPKAQMASAPPPVPVSVAVAAQESLPVEVRAIGSVEPFETVQVKSQIAGELVGIHFTEGGDVNKGDLLFEIDPRPYREAVRQAEAALVREQAQLRQSEANLARDIAQSKYAEADAARNEQLSQAGVVARSQSDQVRANSNALQESIRADQAAIESARAAIESDRSALDRAKLDLSYCEIRSPISGRAGNLLLHAGNYVKSNGDTALVVINRLRPVFVTFGVPEVRLAAIRQGSSVRKLTVQVAPQDAPGKLARGVVSVIDNTVDVATGTIKLKATVQNEGGILWPGQYVSVSLTLDTLRNATTVPSETVQPGAQGQLVYVVKADQTVEARAVVAGATVGRKIIIEKGIAPGETVVTDGQLRLFPGARIQPVPASKIDSQPL